MKDAEAEESEDGDSEDGDSEDDESEDQDSDGDSDSEDETSTPVVTTPTDTKPSTDGRGSDAAQKSTADTTKNRLADTARESSTKSGESTMSLRTVAVNDDTSLAADTDAATTMMSATLASTVDQPASAALFTGVLSPLNVVTTVISNVLSWGLNPLLSALPGGPVDSPLMWALLAAAREQFGKFFVGARTSNPVQSSLALGPGVTALAANQAPIAQNPATVGVPDQTTGVVTGSLNVIDPDGNPLTYTVSTSPVAGAVTVNATGGFSYAPTQAARLRAGTTTLADIDSFAVLVSDGTATTTVNVNVPVLPAQWSSQANTTVGTSPYGVAVNPRANLPRAYVVNASSNTVSVINTGSPTKDVVATINVVSLPRAVAVSPDGNTVYVAGNNAVSVINANTNTVVATVTIGGGESYGIAVRPDGTRAYITQLSTNRVVVLNTATNAVVANVGVGSMPGGVAVSPDNTRVYVANYNARTVSVINAATNTVVGSPITVGNNPYGIAVGANGRVYVANAGSGTVSVINPAANNSVTTITGVGAQPWGLALKDNLVYVANADDRVSIIDTQTNTVINSVQIDTAPESNTHVIAVSPDGRTLYVSDLADRTLRTLTLTRGNTAPTVLGAPTVGTPNPTTGAVTGSFNVKDYDGDPLSYTVTSAPTRGGVTLNTTTGTYTYTPTAAARQQAAQQPGLTDTFTVRTADASTNATVTVTVPIAPVAAANQPPVATAPPSVGTPNQSTGTVTGSLNVNDPENNPLSYTVTGPPARGSVSVTAGTYTYTPTAAARQQAAQQPGLTDTFTVAVSDGQASINVSVTVPIAPATTGNRPPAATAVPSVGAPNQSTGAVTGSLNVTDPDGNPLTYTVSQSPTGGTLTVNASGTYTYTPGQAARMRAGTTTAPDFDSFVVAVSDGTAAINVTVSVPVLPSNLVSERTGTTGANPYGVVVVGTTAYVANQGSNTVSVINTLTGQAVGSPIVVGSAPTSMVVSPNGTRVYVTNRTSGTVSVIDTTTRTVVGSPIQVGSQPESITINTNPITDASGTVIAPAGSRLYVANYGTSNVSVINITSTPTVIATIAVGTNPRGIAFANTASGPRVYVVNRTANTVSVINAASNAVTGTAIAVGSIPQHVAISPDGTRAYVTNYGSANVSVIDTATDTRVSTIPVGGGPVGVGLSPDGTLVYVANANDTISVIDTRTRSVISTVSIDITPESNFHTLTVAPDGRLMITDLADGTLRIVAVQRGNTAPTPLGPTVGSPNFATGAVSGSVNVTDYDGDPLGYTVTGSPTRGSLTLNTATGTYTYTPTAAARQLANQQPGLTDTFTVRIADALANASVTVTVPIAGTNLQSTPYLPFDMPIGPTDKKIFAHYVPWLPISVDNLPAAQDYYTVHYLNPLGEGGAHAAYGGFWRDRPLPRDPINDPDWRYFDALTDVNQARSVGIDGFTVDIVAVGAHASTVDALYRAAQATPGFYIQPQADMSGTLASMTSAEFAAAFVPYLTHPAAYRLSDGRVVLSAFMAEGQTASWWNDTINTFDTNYGLEVAFVPTFLNAYPYMDSFAPFSYGFGNWGGRNAATTNPAFTAPGSQVDLVRKAHALGKIFMQPVAFQDNRPRAGLYEESQNSVTNSNMWQIAINEDAEWVQLVTWNDYAEMTQMAPSADQGFRLLDMQAYYVSQFKYGYTPAIVRDAMYVSHRSQFAGSESTYEETRPMQPWPGTPQPVDNVEVVVFATAPATIYATIGGVTTSCAVGGGRSTCTFPLLEGSVQLTMVRDGVTRATVQSPYGVTNTPYIQDLQYNIAGGLR